MVESLILLPLKFRREIRHIIGRGGTELLALGEPGGDPKKFILHVPLFRGESGEAQSLNTKVDGKLYGRMLGCHHRSPTLTLPEGKGERGSKKKRKKKSS